MDKEESLNLIEQLGGYTKAKEFHNWATSVRWHDINQVKLDSLNEALLQYRRQHNIFEVGDLVVITQKIWGQDPWGDLCYVFNAETHHIVGVGVDISVGFGSSKAYRHATHEEIQAGRRLEV